MDIVGLTPVDTALNAVGLHLSQALMDFLFHQTRIAVVVGLAAYLILLVRLIRSGKFQYIFYYAALTVTVIILFLPARSLSSIHSIQETLNQDLISSSELKNNFIQTDRIPVIFSFLSQSFDITANGLINAVDQLMPEGSRCLKWLYLVQQLPFKIQFIFEQGILQQSLRQDFDSFVKDHYLPALTRLRHQSIEFGLPEIGPDDPKLIELYSSSEKEQWQRISRDLKRYITTDRSLNKATLEMLKSLMGISDDVLLSRLEEGFAGYQLRQQFQIKQVVSIDHVVSRAIKFTPYIHGVAQLLMGVMFPLVIIAMLLIQRLSIFFWYIKYFLWVKSWALSIAISFYVSMFVAHVQRLQCLEINWVWNEPYYAVTFCVIAPGLILLTRSMII